MQGHLPLFAKSHLPVIFNGHLDFCVKRKNAFISERVKDIPILMKFLAPRLYAVIWHFFPKVVFLTVLVAILNVCVKCKDAFILETR